MGKTEKYGMIFDIKHYALHDGPGIRTSLFFKGCPLNCWWCHNPEGIHPDPQLTYKQSRCLQDCEECVRICPEQALSQNNGNIHIDSARCQLLGHCAQICPTGALEIIGKRMSVDELLAVIEKDRIFYDQSHGGVTFTGGEPLMQLEFLDSLLEKCQQQKIHTVVDTSGHTPYENINRIRDKVDMFFYDLKILDDQKHKDMTGVSNELILENLQKLAQTQSPIQIRMPIITGTNDNPGDITQIGEFVSQLPNIKTISLLPYHRMGSQKYKNLNLPFAKSDTQPPTPQRVAEIQSKLEDFGFEVGIGG